ncbi:hypothetical protein [Dyadobacter frigoris]|uniref:hypothetical protein n=1 Tax=Dyadobacter frigoris TaxID=2576211 RepID=UPI001485A023|nr:hypothetical protein [Dyadobacter frigoris]
MSERNEKIRTYYKKRFEGGYRNDFIIKEMISMFALDAYTLEAIVYKKKPYNDF